MQDYAADFTDLFDTLTVDAVAHCIVEHLAAQPFIVAAAFYRWIGGQGVRLAQTGAGLGVLPDRFDSAQADHVRFFTALAGMYDTGVAQPLYLPDGWAGWGIPLVWQGRTLATVVVAADPDAEAVIEARARLVDDGLPDGVIDGATEQTWMPSAFWRHAAQALHHALHQDRLARLAHERTIELSTIEVLSQQMVASVDMQTVARDLVAAAMSALDVAVGSCALMRDTGELMLIAHLDTSAPPGADPPPMPALHRTPRGVVQRVLASGTPALVEDTARDPDYVAMQPGMRSELCVPIVRHDRTIGILNFEDPRPAYFTRDHQRFVSTLAKHAAIAVENVRLYRDARATRDQLQAILDSTQDAMLMLDRRGRLLQANRAALDVLGDELGAQVGRSLWQWLNRMDEAVLVDLLGYRRAELRAYIVAVMHHPAEMTQRQFAQPVSGGVRHLDERGSPVRDASGQVVGWLMVWRDVTEQLRLEHLRSELSNMIVHDLRNPITSMLSSLDLLDELLAEGMIDPAGQRDIVNVARSSAENMLNLVQSLLDVARLEQHGIELHCRAVDVAELVYRAEHSVSASLLNANLTLTHDLPDDLPPVWCDDEKLQRVLANLLDNALRYTPGGGEIHISARVPENRAVLRVVIEDSGVGIPPQDRERIFDKFTQLDRSVARGHKGTGLGLTFCKLAVETHGGHIWVEDSRLGGAAFCFTIPLAPERDG